MGRPETDTPYSIGAIRFDASDNRLLCPDGSSHPLGPTECRLLRYLVDNPDRTLSRDELYQEVWGHTATLNTRTLDVYIARLRARLEPQPSQPEHIRTVRGEGYRMEGVTSGSTHTAGRSPLPPTLPLIGREEALRLCIDQLHRGARLVTVTGPPGIGKSHFVRHLATNLGEGWRYVALHHLPSDLPTGFAQSLDLTPADLEGSLAGLPGLVLDGVNDLADRVGAWAAEIPARWPGLQLVAASRQPLHVDGEHVLRLEPLATPADAQWDLDDPPAAVALFVDRLGRACPDRILDPDERQVLTRLARAADGLPLALVTLAARARTTALPTLAAQQDAWLDWKLPLGAGDGTTMTRMLQDAWVRLPEAHRRALTHLQVFGGPFTAESLHAILPDAPLAELSDAAFVRRISYDDGEVRYTLYGAARAFLSIHVKAPPSLSTTVRRHHAYFADYAARLLEPAQDMSTAPRLHHLHRSIQDIRAAMGSERDEEAGVAALAAAHVWRREASFDLIEASLDHVLKRDNLPPNVAAELGAERGWALCQLGRLDEAGRVLDAAAALSEDPAVSSRIALGHAHRYRRLGHPDSVTALADALRWARQTGYGHLIALCLGNLGNLLSRQGRHEEALDAMEEALERFAQCGNARAERVTLGNLARLLDRMGCDEEAEGYYEEALALHRQARAWRSASHVSANLGNLRVRQRRAAEALPCLEAADQWASATNNTEALHHALLGLAACRLALGDPQGARHHVSRALPTLEDTDRSEFEGWLRCLWGLAWVMEGSLTRAGRQLRRAVEIADEAGLGALGARARVALARLHKARGEEDAMKAALSTARGLLEEGPRRTEIQLYTFDWLGAEIDALQHPPAPGV